MTKYEVKTTTQFKRDYKLAKKRNFPIALLKEIVDKLANGINLSEKKQRPRINRELGRFQRMPYKTQLVTHLSN